MGLAASQARFLAITARKMNCEFQSMQIAQDKLSVTRDMERAARNYQNSLNKTMLIWDTEDDNVYDLSFGLMMTPSVLNEYNPYLVTDVNGRILLTDGMFKAAVSAGIINPDGTPTGVKLSGGKFVYDGADIDIDKTLDESGSGIGDTWIGDGSRNAFIKALGFYNQIDASSVDAIIQLGQDGYTKSGIGGKIYEKTASNAYNTYAFTSYMQNITYQSAYDNSNGAFVIPSGVDPNDKIYSIKLTDLTSLGTIAEGTEKKGSSDKSKFTDGKFVILKNGKVQTEDVVKSLTVGDLLTGKYDIIFRNAAKNNNKDMQELYASVLSSIATALGQGVSASEYKGLNVDTESDQALDMALEFTKENANKVSEKNSGNVYDLYKQADEQNNIIKGKDDLFGFSLTNMVKSYLTNFAICLDGYDAGYFIERESEKKSKYVTNDPTYYFLLRNDAAMVDRAMLNSDFYNMLYNQIATNGAVSDKNKRDLYTTDMDSLQNALKNGQLFISSLHNDGYFYQGPYTLSSHVTEVPDESAIAQAELEYNVEKSRLNTKEESLEVQMKNLDMEISALTTELDSVKGMISKNVEKVFTMFST